MKDMSVTFQLAFPLRQAVTSNMQRTFAQVSQFIPIASRFIFIRPYHCNTRHLWLWDIMSTTLLKTETVLISLQRIITTKT